MIEIINEYLDLLVYIFPLFTQIGIPLGLTLLLILKGSLSSSYVEIIITILIISIMLIISDCIAYLLGRKYFEKIIKKGVNNKKILEGISSISKKLEENPFFTIIGTRIFLLAFAPLSNYLLGYKQFNFLRFLIYVSFAEIIYTSLFILGGFFVASLLQYIFELISDLISFIFLSLLFLYFLR